jgi:hypothetical protein
MANLYGFHNTAACLQALQALLLTVQVNNAPAFGKVDFFDMMDPVKALQEVFKMARRVCVIVHNRERFENTRAGRELRTRKIDHITLIIGDVNVGNRTYALLGTPTVTQTVGAMPLKDAILNAVCGVLPGQPGVFIQPTNGEQFLMQQKVRDELQGRVFYNLDLELSGGNQIVDLGQQPII